MQGTSLYLPLETAIHRLHPVAKVLGLLILFVPALAFNDPIWLGALLVCSILLLLAAGGWENLRRMGGFLLVLFVMASLMWSLFMVDLKEPHVLLVLGPVTISPPVCLKNRKESFRSRKSSMERPSSPARFDISASASAPAASVLPSMPSVPALSRSNPGILPISFRAARHSS